MDVIEINRTTVHGASGPTFGTISVNGLPVGVTLEPTFTSGQLMSTGTYGAFKRFSPKAQRIVIELKNTHPRTNIQIHIGNEVGETTGCILVGSGYSGNEIIGGSSEPTLNKILADLKAPALQVIIR